MSSAGTTLVQSITQMFNALAQALTNVVTAIANWISENADLIASLLMVGMLIMVFVRIGRRIFEAVRGLLPF